MKKRKSLEELEKLRAKIDEKRAKIEAEIDAQLVKSKSVEDRFRYAMRVFSEWWQGLKTIVPYENDLSWSVQKLVISFLFRELNLWKEAYHDSSVIAFWEVFDSLQDYLYDLSDWDFFQNILLQMLLQYRLNKQAKKL